MKFAAVKTFPNLPCAHQQWFDKDGTKELFSGSCAKFHGYDRSVTLTIEGELDEHGWVFPFGHFKAIRKWLEYYFDHTALVGADDPRLDEIIEFNKNHKVFELRVLPYGVSMEMSALFMWSMVGPYIYFITEGRCALTKIEFREHEKNAATLSNSFQECENFVLAGTGRTKKELKEMFNLFKREGDLEKQSENALIIRDLWAFVPPNEAIEFIADMKHVGANLAG